MLHSKCLHHPARKVAILLLAYKALSGKGPSYLRGIIVPYRPNSALRSQNAGLLVVPRVSKSTMRVESREQSLHLPSSCSMESAPKRQTLSTLITISFTCLVRLLLFTSCPSVPLSSGEGILLQMSVMTGP